MDYTVYKVLASNEVQVPDMDGVLYDKDELVFNDMFPSKTNAIAKAQELFADGADWVRVIDVVITENGAVRMGYIFNKYYKQKE